MKGYIYLIENKINGKKYVGKTYISIETRWKQHLKEAKRERCAERPLYKAINKYGEENFIISMLDFVEEAEEREKYWIKYYNTYTNGYNATLGGDGKAYFPFSDEEVLNKYLELESIKDVAIFF